LNDRKSVRLLIGETVREIGILIVVFYPMELYKGGRITAPWVGFWIFVSIFFMAWGIFLERA
jgi:hypothetical protein